MNKNATALVLGLALATALAGCSNRSNASNTDDTKTAMQKKYKSQDECQRDFPVAGDCTRQTVSGGATQNAGGGGFFFMSPFFYPWGGIYHNNGQMSYNNRVPTSGYTAAPSSAQKMVASKTNFANVPRSYTQARSNSTVRGGFGGSSSGRSSAS